MTVTLNNLSHTFPDDIDMLLVGPGGQNAIILSDIGGADDIVGVTLTLDDAAANNLPDTSPPTLTSGTYRPTNIGAGDPFAAPAPAPSGGSALSVFNGTAANGTWSLYIVDDASLDTGTLAGGWSLIITTSACVGTSAPPSGEDILGMVNQPSVVDSLMSFAVVKFSSGTIY